MQQLAKKALVKCPALSRTFVCPIATVAKIGPKIAIVVRQAAAHRA